MRLKDLTLFEQVVLALSLIFLSMIIVDPFMLERASALPKGVRNFFKAITDIGKSNWMLIPTGVAVALALVLRKRYGGLRNSAAYGLIASTIGFVFVSIGGAGLIANLTKNILGRARPKLFETAGPLDFNLFAFDPDLRLAAVRPRHQHLRLRHGDRHAVAEGEGAALHARRLDRGEPGPDRPALRDRRGAWRDPRHGVSLSRARPVRRAPLAVRADARKAATGSGGQGPQRWLGWPR